MRMTREVDYALRIVAMLSKTGTQIEARQIAHKNDIPYRFALKILRKLVQSEIVKSSRGVNGGYSLNKSASEISLKDVIEALDGPIAVNHCIELPEICDNTGVCPIRRKLLSAQKKFADELASVNFKEIAGEME
ncbi:MAG: Rrf2 family transcriptional regulator [Oscillospiraceae bacterium]|nr:Rrf2 family transcriptional regulator [Oscillospiraceae bacterium]